MGSENGVPPIPADYINCRSQNGYLVVSRNGDTPKWMVYKGKSIYKWMISGYPYFRKALHGKTMIK